MPPSRGHCQEPTTQTEHTEEPQRLPMTALFFQAKSPWEFMAVLLHVSREAGSLPRAGRTPFSCFHVAQLNECLAQAEPSVGPWRPGHGVQTVALGMGSRQ